MKLDDLENATIKSAPLSWKEIFCFHIIKGNGHWSLWIGPVLITVDYWGYNNRGYPLFNFAWRPD